MRRFSGHRPTLREGIFVLFVFLGGEGFVNDFDYGDFNKVAQRSNIKPKGSKTPVAH